MTYIFDRLDDWGIWIAAVVGGLAAVGWIGKRIIKGGRWVIGLGKKLDKLADLADYELNHNGGSSIKDAVSRIPKLEKTISEHIKQADQVLTNGKEVQEQIFHRLDTLETQRSKTIADLAEAMPLVARSTPPSEEEADENHM